MSDLSNKEIFAKNLKMYMELNNKTQKEVCKDLNFSESTFSDWINAKSYPRMNKIEALSKYLGCQKSDLIENNYSKDNNIHSWRFDAYASICERSFMELMKISEDYFIEEKEILAVRIYIGNLLKELSHIIMNLSIAKKRWSSNKDEIINLYNKLKPLQKIDNVTIEGMFLTQELSSDLDKLVTIIEKMPDYIPVLEKDSNKDILRDLNEH